MNLLTQIIAISLLITSVIHVTDVFLELDTKLTTHVDSFTKQTKQTLLNNKGNFSYIAVLFLFIVSGLLNFYTLKNNLMIKETRYRKDSYLCMKYLNQETNKYIVEINQFNRIFRALFIAYASGVSIAKIKLAIEITKKIRLVKHLSYLKKLNFNSYCPEKKMSIQYLLNFPYETIALSQLRTQVDETIKLRKNQWTTSIIKSPSGIRIKKAFCLRTSFHLKSNFDLNAKIKEEEISMLGFQSWKCSFG